MTTISVIIPVKNGIATIERCLQGLRQQTLGNSIEIIILDSMSTDGSREVALKYSARIIDIATGTFNHGLTRNLGVKYATANFLFYTVQDAWPATNDLLENMVNHFQQDSVMAVVGHQATPHEKDKNPLYWYKPFSTPSITERLVVDIPAFKKLPQQQQEQLVAWDDVIAMYRKTALIKQPFVATDFAEDWIWSFEALLKGWKLLHDSSLVMYHYHHRNFEYAYKVTFVINYHFHLYFNYKPNLQGILLPIAKATFHVFNNKQLNFKERIYWTLHNYAGMLGDYFSRANFLFRLKTGGKNALEKGYKKYCSNIPQGKQKL